MNCFEDIAAAPGSVLGAGNPLPADTNGQIGSEPYVNTKTAKVKKEKKKPNKEKGAK